MKKIFFSAYCVVVAMLVVAAVDRPTYYPPVGGRGGGTGSTSFTNLSAGAGGFGLVLSNNGTNVVLNTLTNGGTGNVLTITSNGNSLVLSVILGTNDVTEFTNSFAINTVQTNATTNILLSVNTILLAPSTTEGAKASLVVETAAASGIFQQIVEIGENGVVGVFNITNDLVGLVSPGSRFYITNQSIGAASASVISGFRQYLVIGGVGGSGGGGSGTVTSVGLATTDGQFTITSTPVTTSGIIGIAGVIQFASSNMVAAISNVTVGLSNSTIMTSNSVTVVSNGLVVLSNSIPALSNALAGNSNSIILSSNALAGNSNSIVFNSNSFVSATQGMVVKINGTTVRWPVTLTNTTGAGTNANGDIVVGGSGSGVTTAGFPLVINGSLIYVTNTVAAKVAAYTMTTNDTIVLVDCTAVTNLLLTLPDATAFVGMQRQIKRIGTGTATNNVCVTNAGSQTIDGLTAWFLRNRGDYLIVRSDGTNWHAVDFNTHNKFYQSGSDFNTWYTTAETGTALTTGAGAANVLKSMRKIFDRIVTIDQIAVNITSVTGTLNTNSFAIYADNGNGYPGILLYDSGLVNVQAGGVIVVTTGLPITLQPGIYWITQNYNVNGSASTFRSIAVASMENTGFASTLPTTPNLGWTVALTMPLTYPAVFPVGATALNAVPLPAVFFRISN